MRQGLALAIAVVGSTATAVSARADTLNVPADYPTVAGGIQAAQPGDIVLIQPGVYFESINFLGKDIVVRGAAGAGQTILDGQQLDTVVRFECGEGPGARLEGITVRNGVASEPAKAGGIHCEDSSPTIVDCVVRTSRGGDGVPGVYWGGAGGIGVDTGMPTIEGCRIEMNVGGIAFSSGSGAGGIQIVDGDPGTVVRSCLIQHNQGGDQPQPMTSGAVGGLKIKWSFGVLVEDCTIRENRAGLFQGPQCSGAPGGVLSSGSQVQFVRCEILANLGASTWPFTGTAGTGGIEITGDASVFPVVPSIITNCVVGWNRGGDTGSGDTAGVGGIHLDGTFAHITNCSIVGNIGGAGQNPHGGAVGGLEVRSHAGGLQSTLTNTIFWENDRPNSIADNTDFATGSIAWSNSLNIGPNFVDPKFEDFANGDLHLTCDSPAIDTGTDSVATVPTTDFEGDPRPSGTQVDIGVDEFLDPPVFPTFCVANPNSSGLTSHIHGEGCLSIAENDMRVLVNGLPDTPGLLFFGPNQIQVSFGDGFRCVGGATRRLPPMPGMGMMISIDLDLPSLQLLPGVTANFQYWYRDPAAGGAGFNLSDGLEVNPQP